MGTNHDVAIIGGGIVGLATARAIVLREPGSRVVVLEKEPDIASHQTGRNSGVVHSGIYYPPGSLKARTCMAGNRSMVAFARRRGIAVEVTGKLIAATDPAELPGLERLHRRALEHGLDVRRLDGDEAREREPHLAAIAALHVASTGIVDYRAVSAAMASDVIDGGGEVRTGTRVVSIGPGSGRTWRIGTSRGDLCAKRLVNCTGLHSDRTARMAGASPRAQIVPFRGEYFELAPASTHLVKGLIYPVPDPDFPFLGVHLTRGVDGAVHAGPNAVLALRREGYRWRDVSARDLAGTLRYRGFRALARRHALQGVAEMRRSASKRLFVRELQRLVPAIGAEDLVRAPAGVRAQAVTPAGELVDDFLIDTTTAGNGAVAMHVLNAPSPAATASLEIGAEITRRLLD